MRTAWTLPGDVLHHRARLGIRPEDVIVASTGVISPLGSHPIREGMDGLVKDSRRGRPGRRQAIVTTDTYAKEVAVEFELSGVKTAWGHGKGQRDDPSQHGDHAGLLTTDASIASEMLEKALKSDVQKTFNMVSVDGDTSITTW